MNFQIEESNKSENDVIAYVHLRTDKGIILYRQLNLNDTENVIPLPESTEKVVWAFNFQNIGLG